MVEPSPAFGQMDAPDGNSTIPAVYTYFGQFIDHDITARTDRANEVGHVIDADLHPTSPATVKAQVRNERVPALDLDSVYGDGPTFPGGPETDAKDIYDGIKLKVGRVALVGKEGEEPVIPGVRIPLQADLDRDLPRGLEGNPSKANIADGRNDENLIVAQLHVAFLRFHNATVDWIRQHEPYYTDRAVFERARELVCWHYQWLVVHDYLAMIALPGVVDQVVLAGQQALREAQRRGLDAAGVLGGGLPLRSHHGPGRVRLQPQLRLARPASCRRRRSASSSGSPARAGSAGRPTCCPSTG